MGSADPDRGRRRDLGLSPVAGSAGEGSAFVVLKLQLGLGRCQTGDRHAIGRTRNVIEIASAEEANGIGIATMLTAHSHFQVLFRLPPALRADANELPDAFLIE